MKKLEVSIMTLFVIKKILNQEYYEIRLTKLRKH
jgi:hypothetical protein